MGVGATGGVCDTDGDTVVVSGAAVVVTVVGFPAGTLLSLDWAKPSANATKVDLDYVHRIERSPLPLACKSLQCI